MDKIKVMHVFHSMDVGGAQTLIMNVYRNMDLNKYEFSFIVSKDGFFDEEIRQLGGKIYKIPYVTKNGSIIYKNRIKRILKEHSDYQIVHSHIDQVSGIVMQAAKEAGVKGRIAHSHNTKNVNGIFGRLYKSYLESKILPNATDLCACSDNAAQWLFKEKASEAVVINNGIDIEKFKYSDEKRRKIRDELEISDNTFVIGHIGVFRKQKNHKFLIEIFNEYLKSNPNSILILVGDGELKEEIVDMVKELNIEEKVKFLGVRLDTDYIYSAIDLFLFPSYFEGLSLSLIEAQIAGLTILTSTGVDMKTDISKNIKFLELDDEPSEWVKLIKKYNRYDCLKEAIENGYDQKEMIAKVLGVYNKIEKRG